MVAITKPLILFAAAAAVSALETRDAFSGFRDDVTKIHAQATQILRDMPGCREIFCALGLKERAEELKEGLAGVGRDLERSRGSAGSGGGKFSESQAKQAVVLLEGVLERDLMGLLRGVEKHEKLRELKTRVRPYLQEMKGIINSLGTALAGKMPTVEGVGKVRRSVGELEGEVVRVMRVYA